MDREEEKVEKNAIVEYHITNLVFLVKVLYIYRARTRGEVP